MSPFLFGIRAPGTCSSGECVLPIQCGNGVLQGDEECECASGTSCKFCSNCKLQDGKECTPDSPCCDDEGRFRTTSTSCTKQPEGLEGYCNRGVCSTITRECVFSLAVTSTETKQLNKFCGVSSSTPCKAKCGNDDDCVDTSNFRSGGILLADGALCLKSGSKGECNKGSCDVMVVCGNGVVQGAEECECPSGQTQCR